MKNRMVLVMIMFATLVLTVCERAWAGDPAAGQKAAVSLSQSVSVCPHCHVMALKAGNCEKCGMALESRNVLGTKGGEATLCGCESGCKSCDAKGVKDGKCACGKEVKEMSAKGKYVCADGCPEITDSPGKCACGKDLQKVE